MVNTNLVSIKINNIPLQVPAGTRILDACRDNGFHVPYLCYLKDINEIGACRVCVVEVKGIHHLVTSCNNQVQEGMEILTNSPRVREARKINVELLLSQHHTNCPTCVRSSNCELKQVASDLNLTVDRYKNEYPEMIWTSTFPLIRDAGKCIKCMRCVQICDKIQTLNIWDVSGTGSHTTVDVSHNLEIKESDCSLCGQCITHCPVGALRERDDTEDVWSAIADKKKVVVAQVAPAVRAAWGEALGLSREEATIGKIMDALKKIGVDYVFDTSFSADLTIMEEGAEFLERLQNGELKDRPMFTSCCPGWIRFIKSQYPHLVPQLSSAKSPQQMFGAVAKTYFAERAGIDPAKIVSVSVMPCTAKKAEAAREEMCASGYRDVDVVITTRELGRMIREAGIDFNALEEAEFDSPLGTGTGAAVIFGTTGGVMEAALRTVAEVVAGKELPKLEYNEVRGMEQTREAVIDVAGVSVKVAIVHTLKSAKMMLERIKAGTADYQFIEVMACPGGCIGGAGTIADPARTAIQLNKYVKEAPFADPEQSPFMSEIHVLKDDPDFEL